MFSKLAARLAPMARRAPRMMMTSRVAPVARFSSEAVLPAGQISSHITATKFIRPEKIVIEGKAQGYAEFVFSGFSKWESKEEKNEGLTHAEQDKLLGALAAIEDQVERDIGLITFIQERSKTSDEKMAIIKAGIEEKLSAQEFAEAYVELNGETPKAQIDAAYKSYKPETLPVYAEYVIQLLLEAELFHRLGDFNKTLTSLVRQDRKQLVLKVTSGKEPLTDAQVGVLTKKFQTWIPTGFSLVTEVTSDTSLLGGYTVQCGDFYSDHSVLSTINWVAAAFEENE